MFRHCNVRYYGGSAGVHFGSQDLIYITYYYVIRHLSKNNMGYQMGNDRK